jgi:3-hydroxybenzoate 6-monooxygenase
MRIPLLIVGGGIGGLAAALAAARHGRPAHVLEKAPQFSEIGAGLQLAPNATRMLHRLGILDEVLKHAVRPKSLVMRDAMSGDHITSLDVGRAFLDHFGYPYIVMHRADLLDAEYHACETNPLITLEVNREVVALESRGDSVRVVCSDGPTYECDAVVGADGLWSTTRKVLDDGQPICAESVAYRSSVSFDNLPFMVDLDNMTIWVGPNVHFVQYVVREGKLLNQVAVFRSDRFRPGHEGSDDWGTPEELDARFAHACPEVQSGLARINRDRHWTMFDRLPMPTWTRNRVTLVGDAAHPMLQYAAQGACQALEDAVCLGECVGAMDDPRVAFLCYEGRRLERAARVQHAARFLGDLYHASGARAVERQRLLGGRAADDFAYFDWLYGYTGELTRT